MRGKMPRLQEARAHSGQDARLRTAAWQGGGFTAHSFWLNSAILAAIDNYNAI